jgi:hypothetical protein
LSKARKKTGAHAPIVVQLIKHNWVSPCWYVANIGWMEPPGACEKSSPKLGGVSHRHWVWGLAGSKQMGRNFRPTAIFWILGGQYLSVSIIYVLYCAVLYDT